MSNKQAQPNTAGFLTLAPDDGIKVQPAVTPPEVPRTKAPARPKTTIRKSAQAVTQAEPEPEPSMAFAAPPEVRKGYLSVYMAFDDIARLKAAAAALGWPNKSRLAAHVLVDFLNKEGD